MLLIYLSDVLEPLMHETGIQKWKFQNVYNGNELREMKVTK